MMYITQNDEILSDVTIWAMTQTGDFDGNWLTEIF